MDFRGEPVIPLLIAGKRVFLPMSEVSQLIVSDNELRIIYGQYGEKVVRGEDALRAIEILRQYGQI